MNNICDYLVEEEIKKLISWYEKKSTIEIDLKNDMNNIAIHFKYGKLNITHSKNNTLIDRIKLIKPFLKKVSMHPLMKNTNGIIYLHLNDGMWTQDFVEQYKTPLFGFSRHLSCNKVSLVPNLYFMMNRFLEYNVGTKIQYSWKNKISKCVFAGAPSGNEIKGSVDGYKTNKRIQFAEKFYENSLFDISFIPLPTGWCIESDKRVKELGIYKQRISHEDQLKYKCIIDIDGFASSFDRVAWVYGSSSILIKIKGDWSEFYFPVYDKEKDLIFCDISELESKVNSIINMNDPSDIINKQKEVSNSIINYESCLYYTSSLFSKVINLYN